MLIVEGADGSGKTTLARQIADGAGLEYCRPPAELLSSTAGPSKGLLEWWFEQFKQDHAKRVYDRCLFISDPIYSCVMHRVPLATVDQLWELRARFLSTLATCNALIFCMPTTHVVEPDKHLKGLTSVMDDAVRYLYQLEHVWWRRELELWQCGRYDFAKDKPEDWIAIARSL